MINTWNIADRYGQGSFKQVIATAIYEYGVPRSRLMIFTGYYFVVDLKLVKKD